MKQWRPSKRVPELTWLHRLGGNAFVNIESKEDWSGKSKYQPLIERHAKLLRDSAWSESLSPCAKLGLLARSQPFQEDIVGLRLIFTLHKLLFFIPLRSNFALDYFILHRNY